MNTHTPLGPLQIRILAVLPRSGFVLATRIRERFRRVYACRLLRISFYTVLNRLYQQGYVSKRINQTGRGDISLKRTRKGQKLLSEAIVFHEGIAKDARRVIDDRENFYPVETR